ncbi:MAG: 2-dehydropantoate 2-reductase [bacterium]
MKIAIMGSGGVGGYFGARLALAGEDVTFIARGAHLEAIRSGGLRVEGTLLECHLNDAKATDDPGGVGAVDLVVMSIKAYDLEGSARAIAPLMGADTMVLPLLNGVDIAERIEPVLGAGRVLGGLCHLSAHIAEPGLIRQVGPLNKIIFGERSGEKTPRVEGLRDLLEHAEIPTVLSEAIETDLWLTYLFLAPMAGVCAVTALPMGEVLDDPDTRDMLAACMREIEAVGRKKGVALPDGAAEETLRFAGTLPPRMVPSMALSAQRGDKMELEVLNSTAARLGRELGVPTPVNQFIHAALKHRAGGRQQ